MKNSKIFYIIIAVLVIVIVGGGLLFFFGNKGGQEKKETKAPVDEQKMVACGQAKDPSCFMNRMNGCLPVTIKMVGSDNKTEIDLTILGIENEKCHFQRKINSVVDLNCYFPKGTMNWDTIDQTFGNDKGLQKVVDDNCKIGGW